MDRAFFVDFRNEKKMSAHGACSDRNCASIEIPRLRSESNIRHKEAHGAPCNRQCNACLHGFRRISDASAECFTSRSTHASSDIAGGRPPGGDGAAISGVHSMSDYSRRGREASGPPLVISKYSPASARTSSIALLCPPAPPALGREFRFQKAMMALARAEIPPISDSMKLNCDS